MANFSRASGGSCEGLYYYSDSEKLQGERVDFANSQVHQWLGDVKLNYTGPGYILWAPWTADSSGARFAVYPELRECCVCCEDKNGCGFVPSDWIAKADGQYLGVQQHDGHTCDTWNAIGGDDNLYWEDRTSGLPVALDMVSSVVNGSGIHRSFLNTTTASFDTLVFKPPKYCPQSRESSNAYCPGKTCNLLRSFGSDTLHVV